MDFLSFCSCDLNLDQMTFIYELALYSLEIYRMYELYTSRCSKVKSDRETDRQTDTTKIIYDTASRVVKN